MTPQEFLSQLTLNIERFEKVAAFLSVPGYLSWHEGFTLLSLAEVWPVEGDIVEIGSFKGKSTCFLAQGALRSGRGKVHAVDHFRGSPEHQKGGHEETAEIVESGSTYEQFRANLAAFGLSEVVEAILCKMSSSDSPARMSGAAMLASSANGMSEWLLIPSTDLRKGTGASGAVPSGQKRTLSSSRVLGKRSSTASSARLRMIVPVRSLPCARAMRTAKTSS